MGLKPVKVSFFSIIKNIKQSLMDVLGALYKHATMWYKNGPKQTIKKNAF
jgi:hypothetical protein